MATSMVVGSVAASWRFPVKSMGGERLERAELTRRGLLGDRAYALVHAVTGKVVSAKSVSLFPDLLRCRARFLDPPSIDDDLPPVQITLPDGRLVSSDGINTDQVLSAYFKQDVMLTRDVSNAAVSDQSASKFVAAANSRQEQAAFFSEVDREPPAHLSPFFDLFPVSVITTSTLDRVAALRPESIVDPRRFRMNIVLQTSTPGFLENGWINQVLQVGEQARLKIQLPDPRCVMVTLAQEDLTNDPEILRVLVQKSRIAVGNAGPFPCAGVYATIEQTGTVRIGDQAQLDHE